jgi:hypothetical protein
MMHVSTSDSTTPRHTAPILAWTSTELAAIDRADEIEVSTRRADGSLRTSRIVWVVRDGNSFYVRSVNGPQAGWYRDVQSRHAGVVTVERLGRDVTFVEAGTHAGEDSGLDDRLDEAYRAKYGRWAGPVTRITAQPARLTTLRLDPA